MLVRTEGKHPRKIKYLSLKIGVRVGTGEDLRSDPQCPVTQA